MKFILSNNKYNITLPINPSEFQINAGRGNTSVNVHNLGEVVLPGKGKLATITLSGIFPISKNEAFSGAWEDPNSLVKKITEMMNSGEAIRLTITDTTINKEFLIDSFNHGILGVNTSYEISMTEFRNINYTATGGGLVSNAANTNNNTDRKDPTPPANEITVTLTGTYPYDCLYNVALYHYNNASRWPELQKLNNISNVYTIPKGTKIKVPNPVRK